MNTLKTNGLVEKTTNYSKFKLREDNRKIDPNHVKNLKMHIEQSNELHLVPIIVNSDMEVIEGQHRLTAAKELNVPVYYLVDNDYRPEKMIMFNTTQKKWTPEDYLNYWISHGRSDYQKLKDFMDDVDFTIHIVLRWLNKLNGGSEYKNFRIGSFKFKITEEILNGIYNTKRLISLMKDKNFKPQKIYTQTSFHTACREFFTNPLVDYARFFERFEIIPFQMRFYNSWTDYLDQFIEIYNYDMRLNRLKVVSDGDRREITE